MYICTGIFTEIFTGWYVCADNLGNFKDVYMYIHNIDSECSIYYVPTVDSIYKYRIRYC